MDASRFLTEFQMFLLLVIFCAISLPISYRYTLQKKREGKTAEFYLYALGVCGGIFLLLILLVSGYYKFMKSSA